MQKGRPNVLAYFCVFCLKRGQSGRFAALKVSNTDHVPLMVIRLLLLLGDSGWFWVILSDSGWFCVILAGSGWFWVILGRSDV